MIYIVRERQVMLDSDVARLFGYQTKDLNRNVKNNIERFPEYYCFQLTEKEYKSLRCKNFTLKENGRGKHRKYMPYVFTEHGITMLAGLLKAR
ncbi:MAG: ORF6N domain-containing protein [Clostridia bacterium]|nr:ORF6N domain-containing protein [Clostridia bacterium]